jgi:hypothetical protein
MTHLTDAEVRSLTSDLPEDAIRRDNTASNTTPEEVRRGIAEARAKLGPRGFAQLRNIVRAPLGLPLSAAPAVKSVEENLTAVSVF